MYIVHEQKQKTNLVVTSIYLIVFVILLLLVIKPSFLNIQELPNIARIILFIVLLVDFVIFRSFFELKFRITDKGLEFGYGLFKNKIDKNNIQSILIDSSKGNFFGYGIRFNKEKTMGFIAQRGEGLKINTKDQRSFFITLNDSQQALDIIKQRNYVSR